MDIVAVDIGFGWIKAKKGNSIWRQPSVIGEAKQLFEEQQQKGDIIFDRKFFVGNLAVRHSEIRYTSTKEAKAETWTSEILLKTAVGIIAPRGTVKLVTGLPVDFYQKQKAGFESFLRNFNQSDYYHIELLKEYSCTARPTISQFKIVPQPLGSAMDYLMNEKGELVRKEEAKKKILVVDLGFYTLDLLILNGMEIDSRSCSPHGLGISAAYRLIQQYLKEHLGKNPPLYEIDRSTLKGEYEQRDITPLVNKAFASLATQIQGEIEGLNTSFDIVLFTGGWAGKIMELIDVPNKVLLNDPQLGNVRGYEKIGVRVWKE